MPMTDERPAQSDRRQLVQAHFDRLGLGDVGAWIAAHRADDSDDHKNHPSPQHMSYNRMSREIWRLTGLYVSYETLRRWHQDDTDSATDT